MLSNSLRAESLETGTESETPTLDSAARSDGSESSTSSQTSRTGSPTRSMWDSRSLLLHRRREDTSAQRTNTLDTPVVADGPTSAKQDDDVLVSWSPVTGATRYECQVYSPDKANFFPHTEVHNYAMMGSYGISGSRDPYTLRYRCRALRGDDAMSDWSAPHDVAVAAWVQPEAPVLEPDVDRVELDYGDSLSLHWERPAGDVTYYWLTQSTDPAPPTSPGGQLFWESWNQRNHQVVNASVRDEDLSLFFSVRAVVGSGSPNQLVSPSSNVIEVVYKPDPAGGSQTA